MWGERYPAHYHDQGGEVATTIQNDGKELRMVLRDIEFRGHMLDDWEPSVPSDAAQIQLFTFSHGSLCGYTLEFPMPMPVVFQTELLAGTLHVQLILGQPNAKGRLDRETLTLTLDVADRSFVSQGVSGGWFEDELLDIQRQLPESMFMRTCLFCAFSTYHPVGNGLFGQLDCFKRAKQEMLAVRKKADLFALYDKKLNEQVQETYSCAEFTRSTSLSRLPVLTRANTLTHSSGGPIAHSWGKPEKYLWNEKKYRARTDEFYLIFDPKLS